MEYLLLSPVIQSDRLCHTILAEWVLVNLARIGFNLCAYCAILIWNRYIVPCSAASLSLPETQSFWPGVGVLKYDLSYSNIEFSDIHRGVI